MKIARDSLALLRRRDFALLMTTQFVSQAADGLVGIAVAKNIVFGGQAGFSLEEARTPEELLRIALLTILPYAFLSPLLGVLIDRWDRRRMLIGAGVVRAAFLAVVVALGIGTVGDAALYGSFLLVLASTRLLLAIKGAALPAVLGERDLLHGNAISQAGGAVFQLLGVGGALVASGFLDTRVVLLGGAIGYGLSTVSAAAVSRLGYGRRAVPLLDELRRLLRDLWEGIREVGRRRPAAVALISFLGLRALVSYVVLVVAFASRAFLARESTLVSAIPAGAGALGAGAGFVIAHALKDRVAPVRIVAGAFGAAALGLAVFGGVITLPGLSAVGFVVGLSFFLGKVGIDTMMQEALDDSFRGRGFGLQDLAYNLSWLLPATVLWGVWAEGRGRILLWGAAALSAALAALVSVWIRTGRPAGSSPLE